MSKLWVALTLLDAVDRGVLGLDDPITVRRADLTLFHQPVRAMMGPDGFATTIRDLLTIAMTQSDNTANDVLLRRVGGPEAVRAFLARAGMPGIAFGPGERLLQARIAGLEWKPEYADAAGRACSWPARRCRWRCGGRRSNAISPIRWTAPQPEAIAAGAGAAAQGRTALGRIDPGAALDHGAEQDRAAAAEGRARRELGVRPQDRDGAGTRQLATGYNDVGLLTAPDGRTFAVAVMIASTRQPIPVRMRLMQNVTRAVVAFAGAGAG